MAGAGAGQNPDPNPDPNPGRMDWRKTIAGRSQKKRMLIHVCNQNPFTLIFRYYYSIEELGGREGGGGGGRTKPGPKPRIEERQEGGAGNQ